MNVKQNALVSIIVPCYNEQENIELFFEKISQQAKILADNHSKELELIFIDDGSNDDTLPLIQNLAQEDKRVSYVAFSRNFGKEAAIYAGLEHATGAYLAIMDADLQDPPELLGEMCDLLFAPDTSYHCIAARRSNRAGEPILRSFFARQFYKIINYLTGLDIVDGARDFRLMKREMADAILMLSERNRFSKGIFPWVGFNTKWLSYENIERAAGTTKWSFLKLLFYALDGIVTFTSTPLMVVSFLGIALMILSFFLVIFIIIRKMMFGDPVAGWPSLACIIFFTSGAQCFFTGVLGYYISKIYSEVKARPQYIIKTSQLPKANRVN